MNISLNIEKYFKAFKVCICLVICIGLSVQATAQKCNYVTGAITFTSEGGNITDEYENRYILTNAQGNIVVVSSSPTIQIVQEGFYLLYALNTKKGEALSGLTVGLNVDNIDGTCFDIASPFPITVCDNLEKCNYCFGEEVRLTVAGGNTDPSFITKYVYTNRSGIILEILDEPSVMMPDTGLYSFFAINYDSEAQTVGLEVGSPIYEIKSTCLDIGNAYIVSVCDQLKPKIFFDLRSCDILSSATLIVGGNYTSYRWNTGATTEFIDIDANLPATYQVTVTLSNGCVGFGEQVITGNEPASIGDFVWEDVNANGTQDPNEPGLNGVRVNLYTDFDRNGRPDIPGFPSCTTVTANEPGTSRSGYYTFNVYRSNYIVEFVTPSGFSFTERDATTDDERDSDADPLTGLTGSIGVIEGEVRTNIDAGMRTSSTLCGRVWFDNNANGRRDDDDQGVNNIVVNLFRADGTFQASVTTTTDSTGLIGSYCFRDIPALQYYVSAILPNGLVTTRANATGDDTRDSDATGANGLNSTDFITLTRNTVTDHLDFGVYQGGTICGIVFRDEDGGQEAVYDANVDSLIPNVWVQLLNAETKLIVRQTGTNFNGRYCISGIPVGSYQIMFPSVGGMSLVTANVGTDPLLDSDADPNTLMTRVLFVAPVDTIFGINAGLRLGTVPVELVFFDGFWDRAKDVNILRWQTASEVNNKLFEIQRAFGPNGKFEKIAEKKGKGTTLRTTNYDYVDHDIATSGTYYYRLKQIDYDGGFEYSQIKAIDVFRAKANELVELALGIYPNPANEYILARFDAQGKSFSTVELHDISGKVVRTWPIIGTANDINELQVSIADIPSGSYVFVINLGDEKIKESVQIVH